ncbi:MAG: hypothetical protein G8345_08640 [Magnetococcales bacterium]|nr:hypothetical protein [Magnetococcales bacterium]NGZ26942.1 hypothetical protein [Magnetococcales bacterium]
MNKPAILLAMGFFLSGLAWADGAMKASHNGRMVEANNIRFELVTSDKKVDVYITDHSDQPVGADKLSGRVTLLGEKGKVDVPLSPAGGNRLTGESGETIAGQPAAIILVEGMTKRITTRLAAGKP